MEKYTLLTGIIACALAAGLFGYLLVSPAPVRVPIERRRPGHVPAPGVLTRSATAITSAIGRLIRRRGTPVGASLLELAAVRMNPQEFIFFGIVGSVVAFAAGLVLNGVGLALLLFLSVPIGTRIMLGVRITKRQKMFEDQLEDALQLMASSLRAGHSLPQALASVSREAEDPIAEELARVVNETRVGRDLIEALETVAARMDSTDFVWVAQAIAINREIGGNLAEVLDGVAATIRQRNDIRRQVATLSAEGRLSGIILTLLPFGVGGFLYMTNRSYLAPFTESILGYGLLVVCALLLITGAIWMKKSVEVKF